MIFRFRNCNNSPFAFIKQLDSVNQQIPLRYFKIYTDHDYELYELIEFFGWLKNYFNIYGILDLFSDTMTTISEARESEPYNLWLQNEIIFFFGIDTNYQQKLINKYNVECVDSYNNLSNYECANYIQSIWFNNRKI